MHYPNPVCSPHARLTQAPNLAIATLWSETFTAEGYDASVQRQYLSSVAGSCRRTSVCPSVVQASAQRRGRELLYHLQHVPQQHLAPASWWRAALSSAGAAGR